MTTYGSPRQIFKVSICPDGSRMREPWYVHHYLQVIRSTSGRPKLRAGFLFLTEHEVIVRPSAAVSSQVSRLRGLLHNRTEVLELCSQPQARLEYDMKMLRHAFEFVTLCAIHER